MKLLVEGQKISSFDSPPIRLVAGSTEFVPIELQCSSDWDGLLMTVQFIQKGKTINKYIGEARTLNVPADISAGWLMISCFGAKADTAVFGTVNGYEIEVYPAGLSSTEQEPIPPTPNLYNQLISEIKRYAAETEASADKVKEAQETSAQAKTIADQIQKNAEDGVYNGRDGEQGPQGIQGPIGPQGPQGLKGEPGTTDFNELQSIPFTPILSDTLEVTTLKEGAYVVNVESVNVLVNGKSPVASLFSLSKGTFIFKSADGQMCLIGKFGGEGEYANGGYIPDSSDVNSWNHANFVTQKELDDKQDTLVSGQNIKTINNESILGNGNFELPKSPITVVNESGYVPTKDGLYYAAIEWTFDWTINNQTQHVVVSKNNLCLLTTKINDRTDSSKNYSTLIHTTPDGDILFCVRSKKDGSQIKYSKIQDIQDMLNIVGMVFNDAVSQQEAGRLVTTKELNEETGITTLNTSGIGKGLKLENQELSVNTEGLDISKATVEDADQEIPTMSLMSDILLPMMQEIGNYNDRFSKLNWLSTQENIKEDTEHYTISNARDFQEMYIWLFRKDGINTGMQGVLTLDLFGNTVTLGNLETDTKNIFLHVVRCNQQYAIVDFFDAISSNDYTLNIDRTKGTFPILMKSQSSVTLRTSAGNFTKGTAVDVFYKLWITSS